MRCDRLGRQDTETRQTKEHRNTDRHGVRKATKHGDNTDLQGLYGGESRTGDKGAKLK